MSYTFGNKPLKEETATQASHSRPIEEMEELGVERRTEKIEAAASGRQEPKAVASPGSRKIPEKFEKHKEKTHFPPGLIVSEKAKAKMLEQQEKIREKQLEQAEKRAEQLQRWQNRPKILEKWEAWEARQAAVREKILAKWDAQDKKRAEKVASKLEQLADKPEELEKEKKRIAKDDIKERLKRAKYMDYIEAKQLKALKKREHAQVRRDKIYNFFGKFLGWKKRATPAIPQATLNDWTLEGFEDLGTTDTKMSLLVIALLAGGIYMATKSKPVAARKSRRKKR